MPRSWGAVPTLLITGGNGQIGFELARSLACLGSVIVLDRAACDLRDVAAIRHRVRYARPDVVVNAAAYTAVDAAEADEESAFAVNGTAARVLAEEARALGALFVHYSTDHVFDGHLLARAYVESDVANPQSVYGKSKLAGELAVAEVGGHWLVLRTSWVAGAHGENFLKAMLRQASTQDTVRVVADQHGVPTTASLIADVTAQIIARYWLHADRETFPCGTYHLAASGETTWHAYAVRVLEMACARGMALRVAPEQVQAIATADFNVAAPRPANGRLDATRLARTFAVHLPDWRDGIDHLVKALVPPPLASRKSGQGGSSPWV